MGIFAHHKVPLEFLSGIYTIVQAKRPPNKYWAGFCSLYYVQETNLTQFSRESGGKDISVDVR